jgi:MFS family permease
MTSAAVIAMVAAGGRRSRLRRAVTRCRSAGRLSRTPASRQSRNGLDWTNFFIADVQTGFGTFVAFYLADLGWSESSVGLALGAGGLAVVVGQIPGGALTDAVPWKRGLIAAGILMICAAALIFALAPTFVLVFAAETLHGLSAGLVTPALAAVSLGLVGRRAMSVRTGRSFGFAAAGTALTAGVLGMVGSFVSARAIFLAAAVLCAPELVALSRIQGDEIDYARARNAPTGEHAGRLHRVIDLARNRGLLLFAACLIFFQFANASLLPLVSENLAASRAAAGSILISGLIIGPQIVVALLAPWVGYHSETYGRKPLLLIGMGLEAVRAGLFAFVTNYPLARRYQRVDHQRIDGFGDQRPDDRNRPFQSRPRRHRRNDRHCGFAQHEHHRIHLSGIRPLGWLHIHCGSCGNRHDIGMAAAPGNQAAEISRRRHITEL